MTHIRTAVATGLGGPASGYRIGLGWVLTLRGGAAIAAMLYGLGGTAFLLRARGGSKGQMAVSGKFRRRQSGAASCDEDRLGASVDDGIPVQRLKISSNRVQDLVFSAEEDDDYDDDDDDDGARPADDGTLPVAAGIEEMVRSPGRLSLYADQLQDQMKCLSPSSSASSTVAKRSTETPTVRRRRVRAKDHRLVNALKAGECFYVELGPAPDDGPAIGPDIPGAKNKVMVIVHTGNVHEGGTDQRVYMAVGGPGGTSKEVKLVTAVTKNEKIFEQNQLDVFFAEFEDAPDAIGKLIVRTDGHRGKQHMWHPNWFLETVTLLTSQGNIYHFQCDTWIKRKKIKSFDIDRCILWQTVCDNTSNSIDTCAPSRTNTWLTEWH